MSPIARVVLALLSGKVLANGGGKPQNEIVIALSNLGNTGPEVDAAMATLQSAANALTGKGDALRTVAQSIDDLNADAPAP